MSFETFSCLKGAVPGTMSIMRSFRFVFIVAGAVVSFSLVLLLQYCQYGSFTRMCIYTEEDLNLAPAIAQAKIRVFRPAAVLIGKDREYACLPEMGKIERKLVESKSASNYKFQIENLQIQPIDETSTLELRAIKLVSVKKHGWSTLDSGAGPIQHLILQDQTGTRYEVATVSLGINKGDEFLKAADGANEFPLSPETTWTR